MKLVSLVSCLFSFPLAILAAKSSGSGGSEKADMAKSDMSQLEGVWSVTYTYNTSTSPEVVRQCSSQDGIEWVIKGTSWTVNFKDASPPKDLVYESNGRWTVKQVTQGGDSWMNVKLNLLQKNINNIEPCLGFQRDGNTLYVNHNWKDIKQCPTTFYPPNDYCRNDTAYMVATCKSGACTKSYAEAAVEGSSGSSSSDSTRTITIPINRTFLMIVTLIPVGIASYLM
ncbi:hypothetical protein CONCODRAFT_9573 [Conidiobolus coronatus NRRL 28638]|uniref:Uncharacterized protein n=1 Tax=Conidiobolus coronatus (strain ATCC 28846 / CBS 209.66 / NRRL 28638) TaxID=796925 RepID=A0A137NZN3_CONC2|nr:hypothetical protein CONCODRAFT_9573 [Conidiobolus coronatus NRRL 28638]|eukprot:KXN68227.1 hypothetical protein CONCODRAFT_9573 [Conidiobolus coronatus NRRL 28638]